MTTKTIFKTILILSKRTVALYVLGFLGFTAALTQIFGSSPDYSQYEEFFSYVRSDGLDSIFVSRFEPGFTAISIILSNTFSYNAIVYSVFVFFAIFLKAWTFRYYAANYFGIFTLVLFYFSRYFPLHELTQLRVACATAFLFIAYHYILQRATFRGLFFCVVAIFFHTSIAVVAPALFLQIKYRWQVIFGFVFAFLLTASISDYFVVYLSGIFLIVQSYQAEGFGTVPPNPFSIQLIIEWMFLALSFFFWRQLSPNMRKIAFIEMIGLAIFYGTLELPIVAHRVREFYSVLWIFFVAEGVRRPSTKFVTYSLATLSICFYSYTFYFSGSFFGCGNKCSFQ